MTDPSTSAVRAPSLASSSATNPGRRDTAGFERLLALRAEEARPRPAPPRAGEPIPGSALRFRAIAETGQHVWSDKPPPIKPGELEETLRQMAQPRKADSNGIFLMDYLASLEGGSNSNDIFAEVRAGGRLVARVYNGGSVAMYGGAQPFSHGREPFDGGPRLAQWRAEQIAKACGGVVAHAATAVSQRAWRPSIEAKPTAEGFAAYCNARVAAEVSAFGRSEWATTTLERCRLALGIRT